MSRLSSAIARRFREGGAGRAGEVGGGGEAGTRPASGLRRTCSAPGVSGFSRTSAAVAAGLASYPASARTTHAVAPARASADARSASKSPTA